MAFRNDGILDLAATKRFSVLSLTEPAFDLEPAGGIVALQLDCATTHARVRTALDRRAPRWTVVASLDEAAKISPRDPSSTAVAPLVVQWLEYVEMDWASVLAGETIAASYCVRKGIARKAQLWNTCRRYFTKHAGSCLATALPHTLVVETWEAFDESVKLDFGGGDIASFGADSLSLAQRLGLCLGDASDAMAHPDADGARWIVKPSYANKGVEIAVIEHFAELECHLLEHNALREWVLQRYIERPLLFEGRKFHFRCASASPLLALVKIAPLGPCDKKNLTVSVCGCFLLVSPLSLESRRRTCSPLCRTLPNLTFAVCARAHLRARAAAVRAYVLCVGAISVYFFDECLLLSAQREYDARDLSDRTKHLTNIAVQVLLFCSIVEWRACLPPHSHQ